MRRFIDLHTHSIASDGASAPAELVRLADAKKLAAVALTDHDTTAGLAEARAAAEGLPSLCFVPGVEVSAELPGSTLHILGLGIDPGAAPLSHLLETLRAGRRRRNPQIVARLQGLGVAVGMDDVLAVAAGRGPAEVVGRIHIAEAMRRAGAVRTLDEAFARYIGKGAPAYVNRRRLSPRDTIRALRDAGAAAVLAHPPQLKYRNHAHLQQIVRSLAEAGLDGIEAYHSDHTPAQTRLYLDLARRFGLGVTGGSDFHGPAKPNVKLGRPRVPLAAVEGDFAERVFGRPGPPRP